MSCPADHANGLDIGPPNGSFQKIGKGRIHRNRLLIHRLPPRKLDAAPVRGLLCFNQNLTQRSGSHRVIRMAQIERRRNVARDQKKTEDLQTLGWTVLTVWECDLKETPSGILEAIQKALN